MFQLYWKWPTIAECLLDEWAKEECVVDMDLSYIFELIP